MIYLLKAICDSDGKIDTICYGNDLESLNVLALSCNIALQYIPSIFNDAHDDKNDNYVEEYGEYIKTFPIVGGYIYTHFFVTNVINVDDVNVR